MTVKAQGTSTEIAQFALGDLTFNRLPIILYTPRLLSRCCGTSEQDFDTGTHLSRICLYVTVVLFASLCSIQYRLSGS